MNPLNCPYLAANARFLFDLLNPLAADLCFSAIWLSLHTTTPTVRPSRFSFVCGMKVSRAMDQFDVPDFSTARGPHGCLAEDWNLEGTKPIFYFEGQA